VSRTGRNWLKAIRRVIEKPKYKISFWFEWGGQCFWAADERTRKEYGYAINPQRLPLSPWIAALAEELGAWHDTSLNWASPPNPGPWRQEEYDLFNAVVKRFFEVVRKELGNDFEITNNQGEVHENPNFDEYWRENDLDAYLRSHKRVKDRISFWFEWGGECFWPADERTREKYDVGPIRPEKLPLSPETAARAKELGAWHDNSLNWAAPSAPGPWRQKECDRFNSASRALYETVKAELGEDFEITYDQREINEDPNFDEYWRKNDLDAYLREHDRRK
jgi:hypothetical protein